MFHESAILLDFKKFVISIQNFQNFFVDAPTDADLFEVLCGLPVSVCPAAFRNENDFLRFIGQFQILLAQFFAAGQARADGPAVALRVGIVHVSGASAVGFAAITLLVETVAQDGRIAGAGQLLLETNVPGLRTADGKFAQRR